MQFLRVPPGDALLEPINESRFLPTHELSTEDEREPYIRYGTIRSDSDWEFLLTLGGSGEQKTSEQ